MIFAAWKSGSRYSADAQKVAEEIYSIGESATTAQILDKARDDKSELHKCFEWDDTKAAKSWRMQQARHLVCNLVIKEETKTAHAPRGSPVLQDGCERGVQAHGFDHAGQGRVSKAPAKCTG